MATMQTFGNMINQLPVAKKPLDDKPKTESVWAKMMKKGK